MFNHQAIASDKKLPAGHIVQGAQRRIGKGPAAVAPGLIIRPGRQHFGQKHIVAFGHGWLWQNFAFQPGGAAVQQQAAAVFSAGAMQAKGGEFVDVAAAVAAQLQYRARQLLAGQRQHKMAAGFNQLAGVAAFVDHHRHLGRLKIHRHGPGGGHDIALIGVGAADQGKRAVVEQSIRVSQRDRNAHDEVSGKTGIVPLPACPAKRGDWADACLRHCVRRDEKLMKKPWRIMPYE